MSVRIDQSGQHGRTVCVDRVRSIVAIPFDARGVANVREASVSNGECLRPFLF